MSTYVCSDLHGYYSIYEQINKKLSPNDKVICLGDATDRGPKGWETLRAILDNPQWEYLRGNHDSMVVEFLRQGGSRLHNANGGTPTQISIKADTIENRRYVLKRLIECPHRKEYINPVGIRFYMSHSGYYVPMDRKPYDYEIEDLEWSRGDIFSGKDSDYNFIIHGHTPAPFLRRNLEGAKLFGLGIEFNENEDEPLMYKQIGSHVTRIDIDCATHFTRKAILFNMDNMTHEIIKVTEE